jgi:hypothetical protein
MLAHPDITLLKSVKEKVYGERSNRKIFLQKCKVIPTFLYGKYIYTTHFSSVFGCCLNMGVLYFSSLSVAFSRNLAQ